MSPNNYKQLLIGGVILGSVVFFSNHLLSHAQELPETTGDTSDESLDIIMPSPIPSGQEQGRQQELTSRQTITDVIEENSKQAADDPRSSAIQMIQLQQQNQEEEKGVEILEQQEDEEHEIQEELEEDDTSTITSNTIEEEEEEEQNNDQDNNDVEEERQDNSYDADNDVPLELPFP
jgi:hypothetical protein